MYEVRWYTVVEFLIQLSFSWHILAANSDAEKYAKGTNTKDEASWNPAGLQTALQTMWLVSPSWC